MLEITTHTSPGRRLHRVITCLGQLDVNTQQSLRAAVVAVLRYDVTAIDVDLTDIERIDITAITAVASLAARARRHGATLRLLVPVAPAARRSLDRAGLVDLLAA